MKRINHNDLTHYFIRPHSELPASYVKSCKEFMDANSVAAQIYRQTPKREWRKTRKDFEENGYPWLKK
jgi:hypothetical protein